jgi:hypothetical protein
MWGNFIFTEKKINLTDANKNKEEGTTLKKKIDICDKK